MLHLEDFDLEHLAMALDNHFADDDTFFWVDPATGHIDLWSEEVADEADSEGWDVDSRGGVRINPLDTSEAYIDMEDFISVLANNSHRADLTQAIERSKPFRHFKEALLQLPEIQTQWHEYHARLMTIRAILWLRDSALLDPSEADAAVIQLAADRTHP